MKIIGQSENGLLLSATPAELASLCGYYSHHTEGYRAPKVGDDFQVHAMYRRLYDIEHNRKTLSETAAKLRVVADMLETVQPVVEKMDQKAE